VLVLLLLLLLLLLLPLKLLLLLLVVRAACVLLHIHLLPRTVFLPQEKVLLNVKMLLLSLQGRLLGCR
jgi:hypothetical protein